MARKLTPKEFYIELSKKIGSKPQRAEDIWLSLTEIIVQELQLYGHVFLPYVGTLELKEKGGGYRHVPVGNKPEDKGKTKMVYLDPYFETTFKPTEEFKKTINGERLTYSEMARERNKFKKQQLIEEEKQRQEEALKTKQEAMDVVREQRLKRIKRQKEYARKSKKEIKEEELHKYLMGES